MADRSMPNARGNRNTGNLRGDCLRADECLISNGEFTSNGPAVFKSTVKFAGPITFQSNVTVLGTLTTQDVCVNTKVQTDLIEEKTANSGVSVDGVLLKDSDVCADEVQTDSIVEKTPASGISLGNNTSVTGDLSVTGNVSATGDLAVDGNTTLGDAPTDKLTLNACVDSDVLPCLDDTYDLGSPAKRWSELHAVTLNGMVLAVDEVCANVKVQTDLIEEKTAAAGITVAHSTTFLANATVNGNATVQGQLDANGDVNLGDAPTDSVSVVGEVDTDVIPKTTLAHDLGSPAKQWAEAHAGLVCASTEVKTDLINEKTFDSGVTIDGVLLKDGDGFFDDLCVGGNFEIDFIKEKTPGHGVEIDGLLVKDGDLCVAVTNFIKTDTILETTADAGVNVDGVVLKDGNVCVLAGKHIETDTIIEKTPGNGVTIEGVMLKDGNINLPGLVSNDILCAEVKLQTDLIEEKTGGNGITLSHDTTISGDLTADEVCANTSVKTDLISEKTTGAGVTIDGVTLKDGAVAAPGGVTNTIVSASDRMRTNIIEEFTSNVGVTVDSVLLMDGDVTAGTVTVDTLCVNNLGEIQADTINEKNAAAGVTVEGVLLKDGDVCVTAGKSVRSDSIVEKTGGAGVTVDGVLLKDNDVCADEVQTDSIVEKSGGAGITFGHTVLMSGGLTVNGNTTLGDAGADTVTLTAGINSVVLPSADDTHDLGSVAKRWRKLYAVDLDATDLCLSGELQTDLINEKTAAAGVTVDGVLLKDNDVEADEVRTDLINEKTAAAGVTVDGVLLKDNDVRADEVQTDSIVEKTPAAGITLGNDTTINGDATVNGKLTVTGLIDPTGLVLDEQVAVPAAAVAGKAVLWVRDDTPNNLVFSDDAGTDHDVLYADTADHGSLLGLADDDHAQYALLAGRTGGQVLSGSDTTFEDLTLKANSADLTGSVKILTDTASTSKDTGALVVEGGVGVEKDLFVGGSVDIVGKLTVGGLIDPTGLVLDEQAVAPATPVAGKGVLWVRDDTPNVLVFTDDDGTDYDVMPANHGTLNGLADDDHTQYGLLVGRLGGQTFSGSNTAGQDLTLRANSAALDGRVIITTSTTSTSKDTGALIVDGGVGVEENVHVGGLLNVITSATAATVCANTHVQTDLIIEKTLDAGVTIDSVLLKDNSATANLFCANSEVQTDLINEKTPAAGVNIDGVLIKDSDVTADLVCANTQVQTDLINEKTLDAGVTIDGVLLKDSDATAETVCANTEVQTDQISEKTAAAGVTIDGVLLKDGGATLTGALVSVYETAAGTDAGVTVSAGTSFYKITAGTETGPFVLTGPAASAGQVLYVRNDSTQATTGLVTASGAGAVFAYDGASWLLISN